MEDFGNIVYVLAAIGWFFWNAYKKSQKKAKPQKAPQGRTEPRQAETERGTIKSLEEIILQQLEGHKEPVPEVEPVKVKDDGFLRSDLTHSHLAADYQMSQSESKSHRVQRQVRLLVKEEEDEESLIDRILPEGFDLQQAVVLNTILERPYR